MDVPSDGNSRLQLIIQNNTIHQFSFKIKIERANVPIFAFWIKYFRIYFPVILDLDSDLAVIISSSTGGSKLVHQIYSH